jgi:hypothetical protein
MSNVISNFLKQYPLLLSYAHKGLINLNALARYIKENSAQIDESVTITAVGMDLRRYIAKLPASLTSPIDFRKYSLQVISRSNIREIVVDKDVKNRNYCLDIVNKISKTKSFITIVEGEKEIVLMTDHPVEKILQKGKIEKNIKSYIGELSFVSINFPIELRLSPGIYSIITSSLAEANISIHSFHTIGGEILILIGDEDLAKTQEILQMLLSKKA